MIAWVYSSYPGEYNSVLKELLLNCMYTNCIHRAWNIDCRLWEVRCNNWVKFQSKWLTIQYLHFRPWLFNFKWLFCLVYTDMFWSIISSKTKEGAHKRAIEAQLVNGVSWVGSKSLAVRKINESISLICWNKVLTLQPLWGEVFGW